MSPSKVARLLVLAVSVPCGLACGGLPPSQAAMDLNTRGAERLARGDLDAAEARFRLALEYRPGFVEALSNLGLVMAERGELDEARVHVEAALGLNEDFALGWSSLGVVRERQGALDGAAAAFEQALAIDPGLTTPRRNLALLLLRRGRFAEARAHLLRLAAVDPRDLDGRAHLAWCELRLERPRAAFDRANAVLTERPGQARALMVRGVARARLGELTEAADDLRRAARERSIRVHALARLLIVMQIAGETSEAQRVAATLRREAADGDPVAAFALRQEPPEAE